MKNKPLALVGAVAFACASLQAEARVTRIVVDTTADIAGQPYEELILDTWDLKLWWPHSEALYSTLLAYRLTGDDQLYSLFHQVHEYVFQTFPNPDSQIGEWIQIRDRQGLPLEKFVALPVKDPYHVLQDVLLIVELLHDSEKERSAETGNREN